MEFLGRTSTAVVSSTNIVRRCQWCRRRFVITANKMTSSFVPCGIPPLSVFQSDNVSSILTAWLPPAKNPVIHLIILGDTSSPLSSSIRILWSIRSKPLLAYCLGSIFLSISDSSLLQMNPSSTLARVQVREIGLRSFSISDGRMV